MKTFIIISLAIVAIIVGVPLLADGYQATQARGQAVINCAKEVK